MIDKPSNLPARATALRRALDKANTIPEVLNLCDQLDTIEDMMRRAGLYGTEKIRIANEARFEARWKLGQMLEKVERGTRGRKAKANLSRAGTNYRDYLTESASTRTAPTRPSASVPSRTETGCTRHSGRLANRTSSTRWKECSSSHGNSGR